MKRLRIYAKTPLFGWTPCILAMNIVATDPILLSLAAVSQRFPVISYTLE